MAISPVETVLDADVDAALDRELREILAACFTNPGGEVFRERRYWHESPLRRWWLRGEPGQIIAHLAVHDKVVVDGGQEYRIGGVAEVCVRPEYRGHGCVKVLLASAHEWLRGQGFDYAVLFGDPRVYSSSGYVGIDNLVRDVAGPEGTWRRQAATGAMVRSLGAKGWPAGEVFLPGQIF